MHMLIIHDDRCPGFNDCVCSPEFILEDLTVENYVEGQEKQRELRQKWRS